MNFHSFVVVDVSLYSRLLKEFVGDEVVDWLCLSAHGRQGVGLVSKAMSMSWSTLVNDPGPSGFHVFSVGPRLNNSVSRFARCGLESNFVVKSEFGNKSQHKIIDSMGEAWSVVF